MVLRFYRCCWFHIVCSVHRFHRFYRLVHRFFWVHMFCLVHRFHRLVRMFYWFHMFCLVHRFHRFHRVHRVHRFYYHELVNIHPLVPG